MSVGEFNKQVLQNKAHRKKRRIIQISRKSPPKLKSRQKIELRERLWIIKRRIGKENLINRDHRCSLTKRVGVQNAFVETTENVSKDEKDIEDVKDHTKGQNINEENQIR